METDDWQEDWHLFVRSRSWWVIAMRELLGWGEERTLRWSEKWEEYVRQNPPSTTGAFLHEAPAYYILPLLMPRSLRRRIGRGEINMSSVDTDLQRAIENRQGLRCYSDPEYDWAAARSRVEAVLAGYGERLPGPEDEPEEMDQDKVTCQDDFSGSPGPDTGCDGTANEGGRPVDGPGPTNE